jgi:hypothetical protein
LREHADSISDLVQDRLYLLWSDIITKWLKLDIKKADTTPFKINGKILIDPRSGKPLTRTQWKQIQRDLNAAFKYIYGDTDTAMLNQAVAMGKVIQQLDPDTRITAKPEDLNIDLHTEVVNADDMYQNILNWGAVHTGELIQDVTNRSRRLISETIMQGFQDGKTARQLRTDLFDKFSTLNRDWRRIAETETATNFNNGYLTAELSQGKEDEPQFMIGISGAGACSFCASKVSDTIVVLLENAPAGGDTVTIEGKEYTAIWPGKNNFGRRKNDWWVSSGSQHPHCRCTWTRYYPQIEEYTKKLKAATGT